MCYNIHVNTGDDLPPNKAEIITTKRRPAAVIPPGSINKKEYCKMKELQTRVKVHFFDHREGKEFDTRISNSVFFVGIERGQLGIIDFYEKGDPFHASRFAPFYTFAPSVVFENVENGRRFHNSPICGLEEA